MDDLEKLWIRVLGRLQDDVPASQLNAYLKTARLQPGDGPELERFPDHFAREAVEKHRLDDKIRLALEAEGDRRPLKLKIATRVPGRRRRPGDESGQTRMDFAAGLPPPARVEAAEAVSSLPETNLNPKYTMQTFVVGEGNRLAHAICGVVAENPGKVYNPVFLYGGVGLGKTHLMQAVGHIILEKNPRNRIRYVPSEVFTNEYIRAIKENKADQFRKEHRRLDLLLIDDVQFFGGKEGLQEEFFHTFNEFYQAGKQIILTSDRSPKQLSNLQERLVSRFESGVVADIKPPNVETRLAILMNLAQSTGLRVEPGTLEVLAERIRSNVRLLEGAFNKVLAICSLTRRAVTREVVEEVVAEYGPEPTEGEKVVDLTLIQELTAEYFHLRVEDLKGRRRTQEVVLPRQLAMFLAHELTEQTLEAIAKGFGKKDHTTVIHALEKVRKLIGKTPDVDAALRVLRKRIRSVVEEG